MNNNELPIYFENKKKQLLTMINETIENGKSFNENELLDDMLQRELNKGYCKIFSSLCGISSELKTDGENSDSFIEFLLPTILKRLKYSFPALKVTLFSIVCVLLEECSEEFTSTNNFHTIMNTTIEFGFQNNKIYTNFLIRNSSCCIGTCAKLCKNENYKDNFRPYISKSIDLLLNCLPKNGDGDGDGSGSGTTIDINQVEYDGAKENIISALGKIILNQNEMIYSELPILINTFLINLPIVDDIPELHSTQQTIIYLLLNHAQFVFTNFYFTNQNQDEILSNIFTTFAIASINENELPSSDIIKVQKIFQKHEIKQIPKIEKEEHISIILSMFNELFN
ncbi:hypothetical protein DDB_G0290863 [Dictyostelium discoideum AX4]|uniref:Uncharacterized protein n=1 Tax=Dictyostelium discoideum TaxID=44689 RepID=Q54FH0_DICDI|nr:hypothetical protein DDB_G0290863 [Dictyostelium discoideum AX4]EAL61996.1 hypothetical protein DDB_G0290863 [Dictyostelium discoideum AX4]|eukprot:XP_635501.1 hypothetical protein DDB_G0290863 [Dictyostelium discoideum AX4]